MTTEQVRRRANSAPFLEPWSSGINWSRSSPFRSSHAAGDSSSSSEDTASLTDSTADIIPVQPRRQLRHRRGLLVLFLIALYTTFGLRTPVIIDEENLAKDPRPQVLRNTHADSRLAMARRSNTKQMVYRKKEISAFYQQKAFHSEAFDVGWYVNCAALLGVAAWAVAEQRQR